MRRGAIVGLLALVLAGAGGWFVAVRPQAEEQRAGPGDVYLALGDSLAAGVLLSQPEEAYVARIGAALQARAPIVTRNLAVPGATSATLVRWQLPQALALIRTEQQAGRRVSPITIDIGGNDALAVRHASTVERQRMLAQVEANLGALLDQLIAATSRQGRREADIAVMTYYNPFPGDADDPASEAYWSARLNETIIRVAQTRQVAVADIRAAFAGGNVYRYTYIAAGDVHANADGHALIAAAFLDALGYSHPAGLPAGGE